MSLSDASLDLIAPLNVCVVYVSPALQQHVGHQEHKRAQLLISFHFHDLNRGTTLSSLICGSKKKKKTASV